MNASCIKNNLLNCKILHSALNLADYVLFVFSCYVQFPLVWATESFNRSIREIIIHSLKTESLHRNYK